MLSERFQLAGFTPSAILGAFAFLVTILFLTKPLWSRTLPGPLLAKYGNWWFLYQVSKSDFHFTNVRLHREKGKFVQVMPGYITVDDPEAHKTIYNLGNAWDKGDFYIAWNVGPTPEYSNLFSEMRSEKHSAMRRKVASMYSVTSLVSYEPYVNECIELLRGHFTKFAAAKTTINLAHWCQCFAFDAITTVTFGERLGFLDNGEDCADLIKGLDRTHTLLTYVSIYPRLTPVVKFAMEMMSGKKTLAFMDFVQKKIASAQQDLEKLPEDGPIPMVKKFAEAQRGSSKSLTDWEVFAHSGANIGAGSDTTGGSLAVIIYYIWRNPAVLQRLREEFDNAQISNAPTYQEVHKLPYLQAVMKEAFRMVPGVGLPLWRRVPRGGAEVSGQYFPEGTNLGVNLWVAHHNTNVFGPDADQFRPERWLDGNGTSAMEQSMCTFGLGSRTCIGKNISLLELNKLIPVLVREFDFEFINRPKPSQGVDYPPTTNKWFIKLPQFYARVYRRDVQS